jgi:hypothetical protein
MWSVSRPTRPASEAFSTSIGKVRNADLKLRLQNSLPAIENAANLYAVSVAANDLHNYPAEQTVGAVSRDELVTNYTQRFAGKKGPARFIYDEIKGLPKGGRCPYCDQRDVATLDHVLAKAHYPALAVAPDNLVGSCTECNKAKGDTPPASLEEVILHPYFENISNERWLWAQVNEIAPCSVSFFPVAPAGWSPVLANRLAGQFHLFGLAALYGSQAARELSDIREGLARHYAAGGLAAVRSELTHQWHSRIHNQLNSWKTALYEALSISDWYCAGGFSHE